MTEVLRRVMEIVAKGFGEPINSLTPDTRFVEDLSASLDFEETIMECEEAFGLSIPDEEAAHLLTIGLLADYIERRLPPPATVWPPPPKIPKADDSP